MNTLEKILGNNFIEFSFELEEEINYPSLLNKIEILTDNQVSIIYNSYDYNSQTLSFNVLDETYSIRAPLFYLSSELIDVLNKIIKNKIPYLDKLFIFFEYLDKTIISFLSLVDKNELLLNDIIQTDTDLENSISSYHKFKNYKSDKGNTNDYIGVFQYERNLNSWHIFYFEVLEKDGDNVKGNIYEEDDFESRLNPIKTTGQITDNHINFAKIYEDIYSQKFAELTGNDISKFSFPEESRTVRYLGNKHEDTYYGKWIRRDVGIVFNGFPKKDTEESGYWEIKNV